MFGQIIFGEISFSQIASVCEIWNTLAFPVRAWCADNS